ncbi:hypothetical protein MMC10_009465 [Thelotrema lepadinum]|nr:hypothetical protein [Thelotrema lepadinum]
MAAPVPASIGATNFTLLPQNVSCPKLPGVPIPTTSLIADIMSSSDLTPALSQDQTNGGATLGTLSFPGLPKWLDGGDTAPWGNATTSNTDPEIPPSTGVTRSYDFTISRGVLSPDGVNRSMLLINNQFPGPLIEANWGDTISVTVHNAISTANEDGIPVDQEGTSLHWHGLLQKDTPYYDGVPGIQQCPIAPGNDFTYTFTADLYGTSWYHSHYSAQYAGGAAGPMIIHGPSSADYDIDVGPVMLSDWNHQDYYRLTQQDVGASQQIVKSNNTLINGKMDYDCSLLSLDSEPHDCTPFAGLAKFAFQTEKTHLLRVINPSSEAIMYFSIDSHNFTVIANDFVPVVPYTADFVTLGVGQRLDLLVEGTGDASGAYWMRTNVSSGCSAAQQGTGLAAIYYENADTNSVPANNPVAVTDLCASDSIPNDLLVAEPSFSRTPPSTFGTEQILNITVGDNGTCSNLFYMNSQTFRVDYNDPLLLDAYNGQTTFDAQRNVYNFDGYSSVLLYVINTTPIAHPMHLHGHNFWAISSGVGEWDGSTVAANPSNPNRRDVITVEPGKIQTTGEITPGYVVIGYETNNPGMWPFHCHIAWHVGAGLYVNLLEQPGALATSDTEIPDAIPQTCTNWDKFTSANFVDQIDSGLRIIRA